MIRVSRLNHARFVTPHPERQSDYYTNVLGLVAAGKEDGRIYLSVPRGPVAVVLEQGTTPQCTALGFEVVAGTSLTDLEKALASKGIAAQRRTDMGPGLREALTFADPKGTTIEIVRNVEAAGESAPGASAILPLKLGHVAFTTPDIRGVVSFYTEVLGFRVSDWRADFFVFLRCNPDHHAVNFITGPAARMHHIAFELADGSAMLRACDRLGLSRHPVIWGPGRHVIGGNIFTYHRNPDGQIMELYAELAQMKDEELGIYEPRPWHWEARYRPKDWPADTLSNLWGPASPPGFRD